MSLIVKSNCSISFRSFSVILISFQNVATNSILEIHVLIVMVVDLR